VQIRVITFHEDPRWSSKMRSKMEIQDGSSIWRFNMEIQYGDPRWIQDGSSRWSFIQDEDQFSSVGRMNPSLEVNFNKVDRDQKGSFIITKLLSNMVILLEVQKFFSGEV
jgi:hypothetical protein